MIEALMASGHEALYLALEMVRDADEDCQRDGSATIPPIARATIDAALVKLCALSPDNIKFARR